MASIRTSIIAGFALFAAAFVTAPAQAQLLTPSQLKAYEAAKGQSRCPRTVELSNAWVGKLSAAVKRTRALAEDNPMLWSDVGYYEAELTFAKNCIRHVAVNAR